MLPNNASDPKQVVQAIYDVGEARTHGLRRSIFERFDRDRSGKIDKSETGAALLSMGNSVSPTVLDSLVSKFDRIGT
uniref:EF-hand domain-containing protein n=1 Tax=Aegilops tauschii subsp. strangulata TaxID=200361 RepID=A0A453I2Y3_AEGTS